MTLGTIINDTMNEVIIQLKSIAELADDAGPPVREKVVKWFGVKRAVRGDHFAEVKAGPISGIEGFTTRSVDVEFDIIVDLVYFATDGNNYDEGFTIALSVAQKVYDQFQITNINSNVRYARVSIFPGDGDLSGTQLAIPIRCVITCNRVVTQ